MTAERTGLRWWGVILDFLPPLLLLFAGTIFFRLTDADLSWTRCFYRDHTWADAGDPIWQFLYRFGTYPAFLVVAGALGIFLAGLRSARWAPLRRQSAFLVLLLSLGGGLVINSLLKDQWGRPRPREVQAFDGTKAFEPVLTRDLSSDGKSFPCGHAGPGFFFLGGFYLFRRRARGLAYACLALGLAAGTIVGWARVVQGGHFPSDVLWAGGVMWLTALVLAYALKLDAPPSRTDAFRPVAWKWILSLAILVPALIFVALLATPLDAEQTFEPREPLRAEAPAVVRMNVPQGSVHIAPGAAFLAKVEMTGFGLPNSGIKTVWKESKGEGGTPTFELKQRRSGYATELNQRLEVQYPPTALQRLKVLLEQGSLEIELPPAATSNVRTWELEARAGILHLVTKGRPIDLEVNNVHQRTDPSATDHFEIRTAPGVTLTVDP